MSASQVLRESSLSYRQPKSFFAKWKPVYVRLSASALSILPSQGAAVPDAVFELSPTMRVEVSDARRFAFSVVVDDQELVFDATDDTDRERWIDQLSACLVMQRQTVCSPTPGYSPRAYGAPQAQPFPQAQPQTERAPMPSGGSDKAKKPAGVPAGVPAGPGPIDISGVHLRRTGVSSTRSLAAPAKSVVEEESSGESSPFNSQRMRGPSSAVTRGSTDMRSAEVSEGEKMAPWQRELKKKRDRTNTSGEIHLPPEVVPQVPVIPGTLPATPQMPIPAATAPMPPMPAPAVVIARNPMPPMPSPLSHVIPQPLRRKSRSESNVIMADPPQRQADHPTQVPVPEAPMTREPPVQPHIPASGQMKADDPDQEGDKMAPWQRELKKKRDTVDPPGKRLNSMKPTPPAQSSDTTEQAQVSPYSKPDEPKESAASVPKSTPFGHRFAGNKHTSFDTSETKPVITVPRPSSLAAGVSAGPTHFGRHILKKSASVGEEVPETPSDTTVETGPITHSMSSRVVSVMHSPSAVSSQTFAVLNTVPEEALAFGRESSLLGSQEPELSEAPMAVIATPRDDPVPPAHSATRPAAPLAPPPAAPLAPPPAAPLAPPPAAPLAPPPAAQARPAVATAPPVVPSGASRESSTPAALTQEQPADIQQPLAPAQKAPVSPMLNAEQSAVVHKAPSPLRKEVSFGPSQIPVEPEVAASVIPERILTTLNARNSALPIRSGTLSTNLTSISTVSSRSNSITSQKEKLSLFLDTHGLSQYKEAMLDMEYDDIDVIQRFTPGEMDEMLTHIQAKPGARKKFKFAIEDLQKHASAAQLSQPTTPSIMSPPITPPADGAFPWGPAAAVASTEGTMETIASPTTVPPTVNPMKLPPSASSAPHEPHPSSTSRGSVDKPKQSPTNASPPFKPVVSAAPAPQSQRSRAVSSTPFGYVSALRSTDAEDEALFQLPPRPQDVSPSYITVRPGQRPPSFVPPAQSPRSAGFEADYGLDGPNEEFKSISPSFSRNAPGLPPRSHPSYRDRPLPPMPQMDKPLMPKRQSPRMSKFISDPSTTPIIGTDSSAAAVSPTTPGSLPRKQKGMDSRDRSSQFMESSSKFSRVSQAKAFPQRISINPISPSPRLRAAPTPKLRVASSPVPRTSQDVRIGEEWRDVQDEIYRDFRDTPIPTMLQLQRPLMPKRQPRTSAKFAPEVSATINSINPEAASNQPVPRAQSKTFMGLFRKRA